MADPIDRGRKIETIGLCRFSYVGLGGYKVGHDTLEERRAYLYQPERMEGRFRLFESVCLPSIIGQTDPVFTMLIVIGQCFPDLYLERLHKLVSPFPNIKIKALPPKRHRPVMSRAINSARSDFDAPSLQFRLDDDDAMGVDFVERAKQAAIAMEPLWHHEPFSTIDFNRGYIYTADANGLKIQEDRYQYTAIALGAVIGAGNEQTIMQHGHHMLWRETPTLTFPDTDMWMRGHNGFNDSRSKGRGPEIDVHPVSDAEALHLRARFNIDNEQVKRVFAQPAPDAAP
jgi:hypothetical protein